ncbi:MAG TPA: hypothetical protein VFN37_00315 [Candidatus Baltobacteraceae bacterium]|nr:hypothetical protein [Candidatus Baltobacteraceae bacterium]
MPRFDLGMTSLRTLFRFAAVAACSATFAACGGGQSGPNDTLPSLTATTASPTPGGVAPMAVISVGSSSALVVTGTVVAIKSGTEFQIQAGQGVGYFNIYTSGSTVFNGAKPYAGELIEAIGTGSTKTDMSSTSAVNQLFSVSGPIVALKTGGFQVKGPAGVGYINIWTNSYTLYSGAKPYAGESVTVQGYGSLSASLTGVTVTQVSTTSTSAATPTPSPAQTPAPAYTAPATTSFMPSSWGKISAFQVFDDTANGYITQTAASQDGWRYSAVWGARNNIGTSWLNGNAGLQTAYYNALETDESSTAWGAIGHTITWWQSNHPDWVLYACTSSGTPTTTPAYVPGLPYNVPHDIHNTSVIDYQIRMMANYAHSLGYHALAIDEATFWQADEGVPGGYGCGIYQNGSFVRRYTGSTDPNWAADVVAWAKEAHKLLTTDATLSAYNLKLIVNHPADQLTANETAFLANVNADLDETGYSDYGHYQTGSASDFTMRTNWAAYAQQHGVAVLMNDNWGSLSVTTPLLDYSVATYLMGNLQAESLFASPGSGYGLEQWHSQFQTSIGAPCGAYYGGSSYDSANPSIYYRRFANAVVVVNGGSGSAGEVAHLPTGHTYTDLFGRAVGSPLTIASNDGYVLLTSNGCQ